MQRVAVLGATGSIGTSALDVIARHPGAMRASVLAAGSKVEALLALCLAHRPEHAVIADPTGYAALRDGLREAGLDTHAHAGSDALDALVGGDACDTVVAAIVGAAGLPSTLAAARAGKRLLLANKESLVLAGALLMREARTHGATIVPIDSEHNAIFQCRADGNAPARITLTASGGPFRGWSRQQLAAVTPAQAVAHPKWSMGPKISVDSASLMNKGLEVIEAHHLFDVPGEASRVLVHPGRWCIHWWISPTAAASPSWGCRTCAPRWQWGWAGRAGSLPGLPRWTCWRRVARWNSRRRTWRPSPAWGWPSGHWLRAAPPPRC